MTPPWRTMTSGWHLGHLNPKLPRNPLNVRLVVLERRFPKRKLPLDGIPLCLENLPRKSLYSCSSTRQTYWSAKKKASMHKYAPARTLSQDFLCFFSCTLM